MSSRLDEKYKTVFRILITLVDQSVCYGMKTRLNLYIPRMLDKDRKSPLSIPLNN